MVRLKVLRMEREEKREKVKGKREKVEGKDVEGH